MTLRRTVIAVALILFVGLNCQTRAAEPPLQVADDAPHIAKKPKKKKKRRQQQEFQGLPIIENVAIGGEALSGKQIDLADYRGKFVLVDFWGTWCAPCLAELPGLKITHEALQKHGFEVLGVAADDKASLKKYVDDNPLPWENIVDGELKIADRLGVEAFPTTMLIDKDGKHVKSDLFGVELLDELIERMGLERSQFAEVRSQLGDAHAHPAKPNSDTVAETGDSFLEYLFPALVGKGSDTADEDEKLPVGFEPADENGDGSISSIELKSYLVARLKTESLPYRRIFRRLDSDKDGGISEIEFERRHDVIRRFLGDRFESKRNRDEPEDPGAEYVPFTGLDQPLDDKAIFGAVYNRYYERTKKKWSYVDLASVPKGIDDFAETFSKKGETNVSDLVRSSVILAGGGRQFFTAGAVVISSDGLAVTAFHVAEAMKDSNLVAMTADGKSHRVTELLAGDSNRDIALIRIEGDGFHPAKIATETPAMGSDIVMMHHSENRFFTYDRGYVMRHPKLGKHPWMEISADYAPGGSGCGIFNAKHELVGLVSIIQYGDGPSMAEGFPEGLQWDESEEEYADEDAILLVKHAVPLSALRSVFKKPTEEEETEK